MQKWQRLFYFPIFLGALSLTQCLQPTSVEEEKKEVKEPESTKNTLPISLKTSWEYYGIEIIFWNAVGNGASSFGHVSANVDGIAFSWGPGVNAMWKGTIQEFMAKNQVFRGGTGLQLKVTPTEIVKFKRHLLSYVGQYDYNLFWKNCTDPVETGLEGLGYSLGCNLTPTQLKDAIYRTIPVSKTVTYVTDNDLPICSQGIAKIAATTPNGCSEPPALSPSIPESQLLSLLDNGSGTPGTIGQPTYVEENEAYTGEESCWKKSGDFRLNETYKVWRTERSCLVGFKYFKVMCLKMGNYLADGGTCTEAIREKRYPKSKPSLEGVDFPTKQWFF